MSRDLSVLLPEIRESSSSAMQELWQQVENLARWWGGRLRLPGIERDEYGSMGYLALSKAVEGFAAGAEDKGFNSYLHKCFLSVVAECTQYGTVRQRNDPIHDHASLNAPMDEDDSADELGDTIADTSNSYETAERRVWLSQLRETLSHELAKLPADSTELLLMRCRGVDYKAIGKILGCTPDRARAIERDALRKLRAPATLKSLEPFADTCAGIG